MSLRFLIFITYLIGTLHVYGHLFTEGDTTFEYADTCDLIRSEMIAEYFFLPASHF